MIACYLKTLDMWVVAVACSQCGFTGVEGVHFAVHSIDIQSGAAGETHCQVPGRFHIHADGGLGDPFSFVSL